MIVRWIYTACLCFELNLDLSRIGLDKVIVKRGVVLERIIDTDPPGNSIEDSDLLAVPRAWSRPDAD